MAESKEEDATTSCLRSETVFFDFNAFEIKPAGQELLTEVASCLRTHSDTKITVAGNTDERGTVEYNLALGERRAKAVSHYLEKSGVKASRIKTVSYGKEKPMDPEHNEAAWAKNRRTDITHQ